MLSFYQSWFRIGETLVRESKMEISSEEACKRIREILQQTEKPEKRRYVSEPTYPDCPAYCKNYLEERCEKAPVCTVCVDTKTGERIGVPSCYWFEIDKT